MKKIITPFGDLQSKKTFRTLCLLVVLIFSGTAALADPINPTSFTYDKCTGIITITYNNRKVCNGAGCDDALTSGSLYYKNTSNAWVLFHQYGGNAPGAVSSFTGTAAISAITGSNIEYVNVLLYARPANLKYPLEFKFDFVWENRQNQTDGTDYGPAHISPLLFYQTIEKQYNLSASTNLCGQVELEWENPFQSWEVSASCTNQNYRTLVYRDNILTATLTGVATSYTDNSVAVNTTYDYKLRMENYTGFFSVYSLYSSVATGGSKPSPPAPNNFIATNNLCNSSIELTWDYNYSNPQDFLIKRGLSLNGVYTTIATVSANDRFYQDNNGLTRGVQYYYIITSRNSCNYESGNVKTNGISPVDAAMATNVVLTPDIPNNQFILNWSDNATNETKYQIERRDDQSNTVITDLNINATSYIDDNVAACKAYRYYVRVFSGCVPLGLATAPTPTASLPVPNLANTFTSAKKIVCSKGYFGNRVELSWSNNNGVNIDLFKIYRKQLGSALDSVLIATAPSGSALYIDYTGDARAFYRYTIIGNKELFERRIINQHFV